MKVLADECCDFAVVAALRTAGHGTRYVAEHEPGLSDHDVLALACEEQRVLLTEDRDFGELVFRLRYAAPGIVLLRFAEDEADIKCRRAVAELERLSEQLWGYFTVIDKERTRRRALPSPR